MLSAELPHSHLAAGPWPHQWGLPAGNNGGEQHVCRPAHHLINCWACAAVGFSECPVLPGAVQDHGVCCNALPAFQANKRDTRKGIKLRHWILALLLLLVLRYCSCCRCFLGNNLLAAADADAGSDAHLPARAACPAIKTPLVRQVTAANLQRETETQHSTSRVKQ